MKQYIRSRVSLFASYVEIYISIAILLLIVVVSIDLIKDIFYYARDIFYNAEDIKYSALLDNALRLIIGIEFVKMLVKHTPESVIEVLLFAIARKIIVDNSSHIDMTIGVAAIAILFVIKRFLYTPNLSDPNGYVVSASTSIKEVNKIAGIKLPDQYGIDIGEMMINELRKFSKEISEGAYIIIDNVKLKIYSMNGEKVDQVEVFASKKNSRFFRFMENITVDRSTKQGKT